MKYQLLNHWIVYIGNNPAGWSIRSSRKGCIAAFLEGSTFEWKDHKKYGWTIHKVHIDFMLLN